MKIISSQEFDRLREYKGIKIMADILVHEKVYNLLNEYYMRNLSHKTKGDIKILILGAGKGAFERRLLDNGFTNIVAVDIDDDKYQLKHEVRFIKLDLNTDFSRSLNEKFDIIIAIEVIEHLESPFRFIKEIKNLLNDKGIAIITTPNISELMSRVHFLLTGNLSGFNEFEIRNSNHISPIPHIIFINLVKKAGLNVKKRTYNRKFEDIIVADSIRDLIRQLLYIVIKKNIDAIY